MTELRQSKRRWRQKNVSINNFNSHSINSCVVPYFTILHKEGVRSIRQAENEEEKETKE